MPPRVTHVARIVADVQTKIESGEWPAGHKLPSIAEMREIYQCSTQPIVAATRILAAQG